MGGNLFKLGRLPKSQYLEIEAEITAFLDRKIPGMFRIPRYYLDKADFGDLDVLINSAAAPEGWEAFRKSLLDDLRITVYKQENRILSTVYRSFQVDFFHIDASEFQSSYQFLCFNDLGNILGKLFRRFNLKYGEDGLFYVYRRPEDDHYRKDILVTRDMGKILAFLGLDLESWERGFESLDQMFRWVVGSRYFTVSPFLDRAATTEHRVQKRQTMARFVEWLEKEGIDKVYAFEADKQAYLPMIKAAFPEALLADRLREEAEAHAVAKAINAKFNGKLVMAQFPDLQGERLGRFIQHFKSRFADFDWTIRQLQAEEISELLNREYASWEG